MYQVVLKPEVKYFWPVKWIGVDEGTERLYFLDFLICRILLNFPSKQDFEGFWIFICVDHLINMKKYLTSIIVICIFCCKKNNILTEWCQWTSDGRHLGFWQPFWIFVVDNLAMDIDRQFECVVAILDYDHHFELWRPSLIFVCCVMGHGQKKN